MRTNRATLSASTLAALLLLCRAAAAQDVPTPPPTPPEEPTAPASPTPSEPPTPPDTWRATPPPAPAAEPSPSPPPRPPPHTSTPPSAASSASHPPAASQDPNATPDADAKKKEGGRGLEWLYVLADGGFSYINMASFSTSKLSEQNASSSGPAFGLSAGIRLFIFQLGVRANYNALSSFNLWQMDAELGIHVPLGHLEPYFGFHGGYCFVGSLDDGISGANASINGGDAGLQVGLDYYFNHFVSLGAEGGGNVLFLHGSPPPLPDGVTLSELPASKQGLYKESGDSVGVGVTATLHLGFHL